ncbi:hypothetical protein N9D31_03300 [Oligoflexaceae bacterium]|nr:hypothetical protein [Oligoflexaceae bacterium]
MKIIIMALMTLSSPAFAKAYFSCDVQNPCSQTSVLGFCVDDAKVVFTSGKRMELVASVRKKSGDTVRPYVLSSKISGKYELKGKNKTRQFRNGWDHNEHYVNLYSNNDVNWGGRLALEEDASFRVQCTLVNSSSNTSDAMKLVASKQMGKFYSKAVPAGYTAKRMDPKKVKANSILRGFMKRLVAHKKQVWRNFVLSPAGVDEGYTKKDAMYPEKALGVPSVLIIDGLYAIYKGSKFVGYVYDMDDMIQSEIYQDGAGVILYLNSSMEMVKLDDWAA